MAGASTSLTLEELGHLRHQDFQFRLLDAAHRGTESEHQVSNGSIIGLCSLFILSPFTRILSGA